VLLIAKTEKLSQYFANSGRHKLNKQGILEILEVAMKK
jgi:hypothetical protein